MAEPLDKGTWTPVFVKPVYVEVTLEDPSMASEIPYLMSPMLEDPTETPTPKHLVDLEGLSGPAISVTFPPEVKKAERTPNTHPRILVIPDMQIKPGVNTDHLLWAGRYIAAKKPDYVVCIGDGADMASLCSYDKGKKSFEGRRYRLDIEAFLRGMERLIAPIKAEAGYNPWMFYKIGNHEQRIITATDNEPMLDGVISIDDLKLADFGWTVSPFLQIDTHEGIKFSHYFVSGAMGRPVSSAAALLRDTHSSAVMGHTQHADIAMHPATQHVGLFTGIFYTHEEEYLTAQGNTSVPSLWMLNEIRDGGIFDPMRLSVSYLKRRFS